MGWMNEQFKTGEKPTNAEAGKGINRLGALLIMIPGQILFWGILIYIMGEEKVTEALIGFLVYIILANIFSSKRSSYDLWTLQYWSSDLFFKIIFFPGRVIWTSFLFLFLLLRYNLK